MDGIREVELLGCQGLGEHRIERALDESRECYYMRGSIGGSGLWQWLGWCGGGYSPQTERWGGSAAGRVGVKFVFVIIIVD